VEIRQLVKLLARVFHTPRMLNSKVAHALQLSHLHTQHSNGHALQQRSLSAARMVHASHTWVNVRLASTSVHL